MSNNKIQVAPFYHRAMITPTTANEETREIEVCFASDADVPMWSWEDGRILESLSMEGDAMKLERMNSGAPLLNSHDTHSGIDAILGKVVEGSVRVENGNAYCKVRFSMRDSITDIWNDVKDGIIRNLSVGYNVHSSMYTGDIENTKRYVATSWEPFEVSLVTVPADYRATVRGKDKTNEMVIDGEVKVTDNGQKDRDILKIKQIILK